jgi:F-type H+-transporting ATPase subunit alpha
LSQLNRGQRLTELLKQKQFEPLSMEKQVVILYAGTTGLLDDVKVEHVQAFEEGLYPYMDAAQSAVLNDIATKKALDDDLKSRMTAAIKEYKQNFFAERPEAHVDAVKARKDEADGNQDAKKSAADPQNGNRQSESAAGKHS